MKRLAMAVPAILLSTPVSAHSGPDAHGRLAAGLAHPLSGADHVLAMTAVGLWAAALGGRAVIGVPAAFVGAMLAGYGLALSGAWLPAVEPTILASTVVLGLAVALAARPSPAAAAVLVGAFALFHGHAHGAGAGEPALLAFGAGLAAVTALLHAAGIGLGLLVARAGGVLPRVLSVATALAGAGLIAG